MDSGGLSLYIFLGVLVTCLHGKFAVDAQINDSTIAVEPPPDIGQPALQSNPQRRAAPEALSVPDNSKLSEVDNSTQKHDKAAKPSAVEDSVPKSDDQEEKREANAGKPVSVAEPGNASQPVTAGEVAYPLPISVGEPPQIFWVDYDDLTLPPAHELTSRRHPVRPRPYNDGSCLWLN